MFDYTKTYSTPDYDRLPSYDCSLSWECAHNDEQPINFKNEGKKKQRWVHID